MKFLTKLIARLIIALLVTPANASPQILDRIVIGGDTYSLLAQPLDTIRTRMPVFKAMMAHTLPRSCSNSFRAYRADWEIRDGELFLLGVFVNPCSPQPTEIPLSEMFPGETAPLKASWYSGRLSVPQGKLLQWSGFVPQHEKTAIYAVKEGSVDGPEVINNTTSESAEATRDGIVRVTWEDTPAQAASKLPQRPAGQVWAIYAAEPGQAELKMWLAALEEKLQARFLVFQDKKIPARELRIIPPLPPQSPLPDPPRGGKLLHVSLKTAPSSVILDMPVLSVDHEWVVYCNDPGRADVKRWAKELNALLQKRAARIRPNSPPAIRISLEKQKSLAVSDAVIVLPP